MNFSGKVMILLSSCPFFLTGCATSFTHRIDPPSVHETADSFYIESAPPVAQKDYQCGPAALESVIRHWGQEADAEAIGKALHAPGSKGVFNFSLVQHARSAGFWSEVHEERAIEGLRAWLRRGIPPIAMLDTGTLWARSYHFVVLKGFDHRQRIFYANTGEAETQAIDEGEFERRWKKAGYWTLIIAPAEKVDWELDPARSVELAVLLEKNGKPEMAEKWLVGALAQDPQNATARFDLANHYSKNGRPEDAMKLYEALLKENPSRAQVRNNLAWLHYEAGRNEEAARVIAPALENAEARSYDLLDTAGMIRCRAGDIREGQRLLSEALGQAPAGDAPAERTIQEHLAACPQMTQDRGQ
jgi:tetratricopeptide (TPR) repeat protein